MGAAASKEDVVCTFPFLPKMAANSSNALFEDAPATATRDTAKVAAATHKRVSTSQTTMDTVSYNDDSSSIITPGSLQQQDDVSVTMDTQTAMEISFNSMLSERLSV